MMIPSPGYLRCFRCGYSCELIEEKNLAVLPDEDE
jgi:hypothetical protein